VENLTAALQKYRVAVSRGQNDRSSSSSENEYDEGTVTETYSGAFGEGEALCDASRSVKWMQREVQRNLQERMEVRVVILKQNLQLSIMSSDQAELGSCLSGPEAPAAEDRGAGEVPAVRAAQGVRGPGRPQPGLTARRGGRGLGARLCGGLDLLIPLPVAAAAAPACHRQLRDVVVLGVREQGRRQAALHVRRHV
jgi:hypothetical protein